MCLWLWVQFSPACLSALAFSATVLRAATVNTTPSDEWGGLQTFFGGVAITAIGLVGKRQFDQREKRNEKRNEKRAFALSLHSEVKHNVKIARTFVVRGVTEQGYSRVCLSQVDSRMNRFPEATQRRINTYRSALHQQCELADVTGNKAVRRKMSLAGRREQSLRFLNAAGKLSAALHHDAKPAKSFLRRAA